MVYSCDAMKPERKRRTLQPGCANTGPSWRSREAFKDAKTSGPDPQASIALAPPLAQMRYHAMHLDSLSLSWAADREAATELAHDTRDCRPS